MLSKSIINIAILALISGAGLLSWACRQDIEELRPYPESLTELSLFLQQVPDNSTTTIYEIDALNQDTMLVSAKGVRVFLTDVDNLFTTQNSTLPLAASSCHPLTIEISMAISKGDILARQLPTVSSVGDLLETGGIVRVKAFCDNKELLLMPGRNIKIQLPSAEVKGDMFVYSAIESTEGFSGWKNTAQEVFQADWPGPNGAGTQLGYELIVSTLGWSNCARPLTAGIITPFCTTLEPTYTGLNTKAFLVFENISAIAPLEFDDLTHSFCCPNIPAGYPVRIVTVAKLGPDYWLGATPTETGTNTLLPLSPEKEGAPQIINYLRGL